MKHPHEDTIKKLHEILYAVGFEYCNVKIWDDNLHTNIECSAGDDKEDAVDLRYKCGKGEMTFGRLLPELICWLMSPTVINRKENRKKILELTTPHPKIKE